MRLRDYDRILNRVLEEFGLEHVYFSYRKKGVKYFDHVIRTVPNGVNVADIRAESPLVKRCKLPLSLVCGEYGLEIHLTTHDSESAEKVIGAIKKLRGALKRAA